VDNQPVAVDGQSLHSESQAGRYDSCQINWKTTRKAISETTRKAISETTRKAISETTRKASSKP